MPDQSIERHFGCRVAGVDEVGRGPLAGPVVAAAVMLPHHLTQELAASIDDSKRLGPSTRRALLSLLEASGAVIALGAASVSEIEQRNILKATLLAMSRAVQRLRVVPDHVLVDGNVAPSIKGIPCSAVIGGDRLSLSIAAASIVAKVTRDCLMERLGTRYPGYGWERNAGYGTASHRAAIAQLGATVHHRWGFGDLLRGQKKARVQRNFSSG